tara:strand:+ start:492 stop:914 length:423 start_codon:yes stop_codon:yes gene_type:complete
MSDKFKIIIEYIKDLSVETPDVETLIYVKENILKYQMNIDIRSQALKNKMIEVNTKLTFQDKDNSDKKSFFEIIYSTIIKINDEIKEKKEIEKIILCDVQVKIYNRLENIFLNLIKDSGYPSIKFDKKIDFEKLYNERLN